MDLPTQTHLTTLRGLLSYRLRELQAEVHAAEMALRESGGAAAHEVEDSKDAATQRMFADVEGAQEQRDLDEMVQVQAALQRLDDASYGDCADCGEPISLDRLFVQPAALRCAPCQAAHEHAVDRAQAV